MNKSYADIETMLAKTKLCGMPSAWDDVEVIHARVDHTESLDPNAHEYKVFNRDQESEARAWVADTAKRIHDQFIGCEFAPY
jgi:hypothetical protein